MNVNQLWKSIDRFLCIPSTKKKLIIFELEIETNIEWKLIFRRKMSLVVKTFVIEIHWPFYYQRLSLDQGQGSFFHFVIYIFSCLSEQSVSVAQTNSKRTLWVKKFRTIQILLPCLMRLSKFYLEKKVKCKQNLALWLNSHLTMRNQINRSFRKQPTNFEWTQSNRMNNFYVWTNKFVLTFFKWNSSKKRIFVSRLGIATIHKQCKMATNSKNDRRALLSCDHCTSRWIDSSDSLFTTVSTKTVTRLVSKWNYLRSWCNDVLRLECWRRWRFQRWKFVTINDTDASIFVLFTSGLKEKLNYLEENQIKSILLQSTIFNQTISSSTKLDGTDSLNKKYDLYTLDPAVGSDAEFQDFVKALGSKSSSNFSGYKFYLEKFSFRFTRDYRFTNFINVWSQRTFMVRLNKSVEKCHSSKWSIREYQRKTF